MHKFSDFKIDTAETSTSFTGDKIKIGRILNKEIIVRAYRFADSIQTKGTQYLQLQIELNKIDYVVFTGSKGLKEAIVKTKLPFETIIIDDNDWYRFT